MSGRDSYRENLDYLYGLQFFGIKLGLDNIRELLARVGNPQDQLRVIHIAGTNGKGSTAAALAAAFHIAEIPAGLYTSPHLHDFSERIRLDTRPIGRDEVVELIEELRPHAESLQATFFEFTTAMALLSFSRHGVEWAILETGMGGRLDATNVVVPELCVMTPVGLDHTAYLGNSLAEIAAEKAGIFKSGVPIVSASQAADVEQVFMQQAVAKSAPLIIEGRDYFWRGEGRRFDFSMQSYRLGPVQPILQGRHQCQNLALAAAAIACLSSRGLSIDRNRLTQGLERTCWPGRLEQLPHRILLDGAHNPAGAAALAAYLAAEGLTDLHVVIGCKADKHVEGILTSLLPFAAHFYATPAPVDEAFEPARIVDIAAHAGVQAESFSGVEAALQAALERRQSDGHILVAGSLFLVAAARQLLMSDTERVSIIR